jgi:transposase
MATRTAHGPGGAPAAGARRSRPPYPAQFRQEAVALVHAKKGSVPQIARELGVHQETLRRWVRQAEVDGGQRDGVATDARAELARLRRDVARLTAERDLLKQALGFFARESAPR